MRAVRTMSFNLRCDRSEDGQNRWTNRRPAVRSVLERLKPDLLGIQEGLKNQLNDLQLWLHGYVMVGRGRESDFGGEHTAVFFQTNQFELLSHGDFWVSETPDVPGSKSWGSACPRTVTWALLRHDTGRNKGAKILFLNTHLDHVSELARENGATLILDFIRRFKDVDGIIVTGDFNDEKQSIVRRFVEELGLADTLAAVNATGPTFHGFTGNGFTRIDYILASPDLKVVHGEVVTDKPHGLFVSDHFPIYADIVLERQTS